MVVQTTTRRSYEGDEGAPRQGRSCTTAGLTRDSANGEPGPVYYRTANKCPSKRGKRWSASIGLALASDLVQALGLFTMLLDVAHFLVDDPGRRADNPIATCS